MKKQNSRNSATFILLFAALISAFGPIVTDLYLPALPQMNDVFHTNISMVQLSLTVSFLGLAIGQMLFGPLSDKYGRKKPLMISLILFILSTAGCIFSWNIESFIFFRLFQGFAGAGGIVVSKSIAVDLYRGKILSKFMSMLAAVQGLAPILAPIAGGSLMKITDWQGLFVVLLAIGIFIFLVSIFYKETLKPGLRLQESVINTFRHFKPILKNRKFMYYTLALGFTMGGFFGYISASPFIFQDLYQLSPLQYSLLFGVNAIGFIIGSQLIRLFKHSEQALMAGTVSFILATVLLSVLLISGAHVAIIETFFFMMIVSIGITTPVLTTMALELERKTAGNASAILGFTQFLFGCIASPLVGLGNIAFATGVTLVVCSVICGLFVFATLKSDRFRVPVLNKTKQEQATCELAFNTTENRIGQ